MRHGRCCNLASADTRAGAWGGAMSAATGATADPGELELDSSALDECDGASQAELDALEAELQVRGLRTGTVRRHSGRRAKHRVQLAPLSSTACLPRVWSRALSHRLPSCPPALAGLTLSDRAQRVMDDFDGRPGSGGGGGAAGAGAHSGGAAGTCASTDWACAQSVGGLVDNLSSTLLGARWQAARRPAWVPLLARAWVGWPSRSCQETPAPPGLARGPSHRLLPRAAQRWALRAAWRWRRSAAGRRWRRRPRAARWRRCWASDRATRRPPAPPRSAWRPRGRRRPWRPARATAWRSAWAPRSARWARPRTRRGPGGWDPGRAARLPRAVADAERAAGCGAGRGRGGMRGGGVGRAHERGCASSAGRRRPAHLTSGCGLARKHQKPLHSTLSRQPRGPGVTRSWRGGRRARQRARRARPRRACAPSATRPRARRPTCGSATRTRCMSCAGASTSSCACRTTCASCWASGCARGGPRVPRRAARPAARRCGLMCRSLSDAEPWACGRCMQAGSWPRSSPMRRRCASGVQTLAAARPPAVRNR